MGENQEKIKKASNKETLFITHHVYPDKAGELSKLLFELTVLFHRGL